ncbi:MAG: hypothetical protein M1365_11755 [Actinobacteria bacterium]|nr:hypothetical protein [Actinomycetota bacterium]
MTAHQKEEKEPIDGEVKTNELANNPSQVRTLLSWRSAGRPFRKRSRQYYASSILIVFLIEIILFLFSQYLLMLVVLSLLFLAFSLASVPPKDFHYRISTEGISVEDHFFLWQELYDFYFKKRQGQEVLHVRTHAFIPGELTFTLGSISKEHLKNVLLPYLPHREIVGDTFMEKAEDWLTRNFPLEKDSS